MDTDKKNEIDNISASNSEAGLVGWVMTRVKDWESYRNTNFNKKWDEYYRLWRGVWKAEDKNRESERSKLVSPALSQAIEATVSELEEATFGGAKWFDVDDDTLDEDKTDIAMFRDQLEEDLDRAYVPSAVSEIFLNGAIYGTGIGKIVLEEKEEKVIEADPIGDTPITTPAVSSVSYVECGLVAVHPQEFVIDPSARTIKDALGMAHITAMPKHIIEGRQEKGIYKDVELGGYSDTVAGGFSPKQSAFLQDVQNRDKVMITEYHGLVPKSLLPLDLEEGEVEVDLFEEDKEVTEVDETDMIEAIVTIANGAVLLRGIENPNLMKDRCFIAYQHDTVPNQFWGRGIAEKGYNPQKALDAELRGRIDAMALSIHPMMGVDATRLVRGANFKIAPGRNVLTNGDPNTILRPFNFGQVNPSTFTQSGELERMIQMGTGAMDSATPVSENRRNETSSGMSMIMSGAIKRSKRTLANIERMFIKPLIHKVAWRYIQFAPDRYPAVDVKFVVHSTLGLVARELEQQQLSTMMNTVPTDSPAFWLLLKAVYENSSIENREEMLPVIDQMMQQSLAKASQPPPEDPLVALKKQELQNIAQNNQMKAQVDQGKLQLAVQEAQTDAQIQVAKIQLEEAKLALQEQEMVLDGKIEMAKMEQDSQVTVAQMHQKSFSEARAATKEASKGTEKQPLPTINVAVGGKKQIDIVRTANGLSGTMEEV